MTSTTTWADLASLAPVLAVLAAAFALMAMRPGPAGAGDGRRPAVALAGLATAAALVVRAWYAGPQSAFDGSVLIHRFALYVALLVISGTALTTLASVRFASRAGIGHGEYYMLLLFAASGMMMLPMADDFLMLFLSLEVLSLAVYSLTGVRREDPAANEGAVKYFVMGSFASAILLFGIALTYGATGTVGFGAAGTDKFPALLIPGALLILVGFAFKIGSVPFHLWVPDAYEGAPAPVAGFMAVGVKAAAFGALVKILLGVLWPASAGHREMLHDLLWGLSAATMVTGNVAAVAQTSFKRMLAYSSIAHTGYLLMGLATALGMPSAAEAHEAASAMLFYLTAYLFATFGAFAVAGALVKSDGAEVDRVELFSGLSRKRPVLAAALSLFLLSLAGVPPAGGFLAKLLLFKSALSGGEIALAVIAIGSSIVSVSYYLRPIVTMYFREPSGAWGEEGGRDGSAIAALAIAAAGTLLLGILPALPIDLTADSIRSLLAGR